MLVSFNTNIKSHNPNFTALSSEKIAYYTRDPACTAQLKTLVQVDNVIKLEESDIQALVQIYKKLKASGEVGVTFVLEKIKALKLN